MKRKDCMTKKKIIKKIRKALNELLPDLLDKDDATWTREIKTALGSLAKKKFGCYVATDLRDPEGNLQFDRKEWLYDVTCLKFDRDEYLKRVLLVVECEWGRKSSIYYDFEKLLLARADVRVMIFTGSSDIIDEVFTELAAYICKCEHTLPGDTYLLVAGEWDDDNGSWIFRYRLVKAYKKIRNLR